MSGRREEDFGGRRRGRRSRRGEGGAAPPAMADCTRLSWRRAFCSSWAMLQCLPPPPAEPSPDPPAPPPESAVAARAEHAHAFTAGRDIYFGDGSYEPQTEATRHLLAHEVAHVLQQTARSDGQEPIILA